MIICLICLSVCIIFSAVFVPLVIKYSNNYPTKCKKPLLIVPMGKNSEDAEIIFREIIFYAAYLYCDIDIVVADFGTDKEILEIFDKLMTDFHEYKVIRVK